MDAGAESLARAIGARVKQERKTRDWTLDRLAETAGLSRRMLVNVEQGTVNPSVGTLLRLSDALGLQLPALVEPPTEHTTKITRGGEGAVLWRGDQGGTGVLVTCTERPDVVELWEWTLLPGERHDSEAHSTGTRELLHLHEGVLRLTAGEDAVELQAGDALAFHGDLPHSYANPHQVPARFSLTVFEPGIGAAPRTETTHE